MLKETENEEEMLFCQILSSAAFRLSLAPWPRGPVGRFRLSLAPWPPGPVGHLPGYACDFEIRSRP